MWMGRRCEYYRKARRVWISRSSSRAVRCVRFATARRQRLETCATDGTEDEARTLVSSCSDGFLDSDLLKFRLLSIWFVSGQSDVSDNFSGQALRATRKSKPP